MIYSKKKGVNEMSLLKLADHYKERIIALRREIHQFPETANEEKQTSALIARELSRLSIPYRSCGTGILACIEGAQNGRTVLLRADMDALAVNEETEFAFASKRSGYMHACGHDGHTAMLLGAAMLLQQLRPELKGTVLLAFQAAEEVAAGARTMIADGALDGVDACFGMHLMAGVPAGKIWIPDGPVLSAADQFRISVKGRGGHASQPHTAVDAVVTAAAIITALQSVVSREVAPQEPGVVTVGRMEAGTLFNFVAETALLEGTVRAYDETTRQRMEDSVKRISTATAAAYRAEAECEYHHFCGATVNDAQAAEQMRCSARKLFGEAAVESKGRLMISEDFSEFAQRVPSAFALVGIYDESCGAVYPNHSGHFCFDEAVLEKGAALYAAAAMDFLQA